MRYLLLFIIVFIFSLNGFSRVIDVHQDLNNTYTDATNDISTGNNYKYQYPPEYVTPPDDFVPGEFIVNFGFDVEFTRDTQGIWHCQNHDIDYLLNQFKIVEIEKLFPSAKKPDVNGYIIFKGKQVKIPDLTRTYLFKVQPGVDIREAIGYFNGNPLVKYSEYNGIYKIQQVYPDDTYFPNQWNMNQTNDADIDAPEGWDTFQGSSNVRIGIIDTGVEWDHPDLDSKIFVNNTEFYGIPGIDDDGNGYIDDIRGWDFYNDDNNPYDDNSHGTGCAGIAGAESNNAQGVAGIDWSAMIVPLKVCSSGGGCTWQDIADAIVYSGDMGFEVISMSLGGYSYSSAIADACTYAYALDVFITAAAGNNNYDITGYPIYPCCYPEVMCVSATFTDDRRISRITNGDCDAFWWWGSNYGSCVEISAPGELIWTANLGGSYRSNFNGTSAATPHVAGVAAMVRGQNPSLTNQQTREILQQTADDLVGCPVYEDVPGWDPHHGWGRVNLFKALNFNPVVVTSPDGGECLTCNDNWTIYWNYYGSGFSLTIEVSYDNGANWNILATGINPASNSWIWNSIPYEGSNQCFIRLTDDLGNTDVSDGPFTIGLWDGINCLYCRCTSIEVLYPDGQEILTIGSNVNILWSTTGNVGLVNIYLHRNGYNPVTREVIALNEVNDGSYTWTVTPPFSNNSFIEIANSDCPDYVYDVSDFAFSIIGSITILSPNGGEQWAANTQRPITWTSEYVNGNVKIEFSRGPSYPWQTITASTPNDGYFIWTLPNIVTRYALIRITSIASSLVYDVSDNYFSIVRTGSRGRPAGIELDNLVGIKTLFDNSMNELWVFFRNPDERSDFVNISIFDISGRKTHSLRLNLDSDRIACFSLSTDNIPSGIYIINADTDNYNFKSKLILFD